MNKVHYRFVFNRKSDKLRKGDTSLIQIEARVAGRKKYFNTGIRIEKTQWNGTKVIKHPQELSYNRDLARQMKALEDFEFSKSDKGIRFTLEMFDEYRQNKTGSRNFIEFVEREITHRAEVSEIRPSTYQNHMKLVISLKEYKKIRDFSDLTLRKIMDWDRHIRSRDNVNFQSTVWTYHKRMKTYIGMATKKGYLKIEDNPYFNFQVQRGKQGERKYLSLDELRLIEKKALPINRLERVRDVFVFCCYTGLAFRDAELLSQENLVDINGSRFLKIYRAKTDERVSLMLLDKPWKIIQKYEGLENNRLLPVITNQRMNAYLKEIADLAGVESKLTTHVARHTFATTIALNNGIPLEVLQKMLGHSKISTTQIYAKIIDSRIVDEMTKLQGKLGEE